VPENASRNGPQRPPAHGELLGLTGRRHPGGSIEGAQCFVKGQVARRPDVGASQSHQQVDVGGPRSDTPDPHQVLTCLIVAVAPQSVQRQLPSEDLLREAAGVARLLPGQPEIPKPR